VPRPAAAENVFRAIADPTRRGLLDRLRHGPSAVGPLAARFDLTLPAVSQHLRVLREADLVREQRDGRLRVYRLHPAPLREVLDWITHYERFWQDKLGALERYLDREKKK
jgi:DNA-binding transcriptional ArsR family regulator